MTKTLTNAADSYVSVTPLEAVYGMGGNDTLTASSGGNLLAGGLGSDKLYGGDGADTIFGDDAAGEGARNILYGKGGTDAIYSYSGADAIYGGGGNDTVVAFAAAALQVVDGGGGTDQLQLLAYAGTSAGLTLNLSASAVLQVNGAASATYLNFESLVITGGTGGNFITGGALNDTLTNSLNNVASFKAGLLDGGDGDDALAVFGFVDVAKTVETVLGGSGNDTFVWANGAGNGHDVVVNGSKGTISSDGKVFLEFSGIEVLRIQTYAGYTGTVQVTGIAGIDTVDIYAASSVVKTGDGNDSVVIQSGASTVSGGAGEDVISTGFGNGAGYDFSGDGGNDRIYAGTGAGSLSGGGGADSLYGGLSLNTLDGGDGADFIISDNGRSQIFGGAGNDTLDFSGIYLTITTGHAVIDGGEGRDTLMLDLSGFSGAFTKNLSNASVTLDDGTVVKNCEAVTFTSGAGNDKLTASNDAKGAAANILSGGLGNDKLTASVSGAALYGGDGNDTAVGSDGKDSLNGGSGSDSLTGGLGKDTLIGGSGTDSLTGGGDADVFYFGSASDTSKDLATCDRILDFSHDQKDKIDLHDLDSLVFVGSKGFSGAAGEVRYLQVDQSGTAQDHTEILVDLNGDKTADVLIDVAGLIAFTASDFILA